MYHIALFLTSPATVELIVTINGEASNSQSTRAGTYTLQETNINGKAHWLQDPPGSNAIWYELERIKEWRNVENLCLYLQKFPQMLVLNSYFVKENCENIQSFQKNNRIIQIQ